MKYVFILLLSLFFLSFSGCSFDESFEATQQRDGDDISVLQDVGPQALDQMLQAKSSSSASSSVVKQISQPLPSSDGEQDSEWKDD